MTFNTMVIMRWNDALLGVYIARSSSAKPAREHVTTYTAKLKVENPPCLNFAWGLYRYVTFTPILHTLTVTWYLAAACYVLGMYFCYIATEKYEVRQLISPLSLC